MAKKRSMPEMQAPPTFDPAEKYIAVSGRLHYAGGGRLWVVDPARGRVLEAPEEAGPILRVADRFLCIPVGVSLILLLANLRRMPSPHLRTALLPFAVIGLVMAAAVALYPLLSMPLRPVAGIVPLPRLAFYFGLLSICHYLLFTRFFQPISPADFVVEEDFVRRNGLPDREREITNLLVQGTSREGISESLFISPKIVKNHIYRIYQKDEACNRPDLLNRVWVSGPTDLPCAESWPDRSVECLQELAV